VEQFAGDVKTLLESMTVLKGYTFCRIRSHYLHQGIWRYQIERFRGAEYDFNMAEASYDQQETPTPDLLRAEREHLVLLSPDDEILDLHPFYQLYYGDETAREAHLCFMKHARSVDGRITQLIGESVRNSREIELLGRAEYDRLLDRIRACYALEDQSLTALGSMSMTKAKMCNPASVAASRSKSRAKRRKRAVQAKLRSTTQRRGNNTKPFLASGTV
jgi:hypothetical protein